MDNTKKPPAPGPALLRLRRLLRGGVGGPRLGRGGAAAAGAVIGTVRGSGLGRVGVGAVGDGPLLPKAGHPLPEGQDEAPKLGYKWLNMV